MSLNEISLVIQNGIGKSLNDNLILLFSSSFSSSNSFCIESHLDLSFVPFNGESGTACNKVQAKPRPVHAFTVEALILIILSLESGSWQGIR